MTSPLALSSRWRRNRRGLLGVANDGGDRAGLLVADEANDANAVLHRDVHGVDHLAIVEVLVRLEVHDLVLSAGIVDLLQSWPNVRVFDRLLVQIVVAVFVD